MYNKNASSCIYHIKKDNVERTLLMSHHAFRLHKKNNALASIQINKTIIKIKFWFVGITKEHYDLTNSKQLNSMNKILENENFL